MASVLDAPAHEPNATPKEQRFVGRRWGKIPAVRFVLDSVADDRTTPDWPQDAGDVARSSHLSGFANTIRQIADLASSDEMDEYGVLRPTEYALRTTIEVLVGALLERMGDVPSHRQTGPFPRGCVTTDEQRGLRIEWSGDDRAVHLVVPAAEGGRSYIYHETGEVHAAEERVTGSVLADWLRRMFD